MTQRLCLLLLFLPCSLFSYQYELSICAMFQNEAEWLKEWIEYHRVVGVEHFWLYNNDSTDHYKEVLNPYIKEGVVKLINWPSPSERDWTPYQKEAYQDCLLNIRYRTKWLAFIDIDEFIVPKSADMIPKVLAPFEQRKKVGGVILFWQMFGTSSQWTIPPGKTMVETLVRKARKNHPHNTLFKTICRPELVKHPSVHRCYYRPPFIGVTMNGKEGGQQPIQIDEMCVHHYWTRTEKYFYETKLARRHRCCGKDYTESEIQSLLSSFNLVKDESILRYVPALKKRLK